MLDGYTTSDRYPYSQSETGSGGLNSDFNYVRNSVKATVDAYDGTVDVLRHRQEGPDHPVLPRGVPRPLHRLLEDAAGVCGRTCATRRTSSSSSPTCSRRTTSSNRAASTTATSAGCRLAGPERGGPARDDGHRPSSQRATQRAPQITATTKRQDPYYLYIRLPGDKQNSFLILQPFVPVSKDNQRTDLSSFLTAKSDPSNYGKLEAFVMPQGLNVNGPVQVANSIESDPTISQQFTLLSQGGSDIRRDRSS